MQKYQTRTKRCVRSCSGSLIENAEAVTKVFAKAETVILSDALTPAAPLPAASDDDLLAEIMDEAAQAQSTQPTKRVTAHSARYVTVDEIGSGGMGTVVRSLDRQLQREVAMKVLRDGASSEQKQRFMAEARLTGLLEHPNIIPVHELGYDDSGEPFFTMKHVRGRSLEDLLLSYRKIGIVIRNYASDNYSIYLSIFVMLLNLPTANRLFIAI